MGKLEGREKSWTQRKSIISIVLIILFVVLLAAVIVVWKLNTLTKDNLCFTADCVETSYFLLDSMDPKADPCENFYNFTCGNYAGDLLMQNLQTIIDRRMRSFIVGSITDEDSRSIKLQKKYYQTCMNLTAIEEDQNETVKKLFDELGGWPLLVGDQWNDTEFHWGKMVEECKDLGLYYDWFINVDNFQKNYENLLYITAPDNVNKVEDGTKEKYVELMAGVVKLLGAQGDEANITMSLNEVVEFERELLKMIEESRLNVTDVDYTLEDMEKKFSYVPWSSLLKNVVLPKYEKIILSVDTYLRQLADLVDKTPKRVQANYIFWKLTESFSTFLSYNVRRKFEDYATLSEHYKFPTNREEYCFALTSTMFAYVSEAEYVRRYAEDREPVQKMVDHIKSILHDHIEAASWMSESDKSQALYKLRILRVIIGGPEEMYKEREFDKILGVDQIDLSGINGTIEIICAVDKSRDLYNLNFVKPRLTLEKARFYQGSVYLSSIKYLSDENIMYLPAAVLDSLFYSQNRPNYLNYGLLGTIIGHELAHGFGEESNTGAMERIQWTSYTYEHFLKATECLLEDCNSSNFWLQMSCNDTFEESFADYVGVNLAYEAYKHLEKVEGEEQRLPGLELNANQLFWMIYSSFMCNNVFNSTEESGYMLPDQRITGAFRNSEYFANDFKCAVGSYMNPEKKCRIL